MPVQHCSKKRGKTVDVSVNVLPEFLLDIVKQNAYIFFQIFLALLCIVKLVLTLIEPSLDVSELRSHFEV